jgi:hypothetical protein
MRRNGMIRAEDAKAELLSLLDEVFDACESGYDYRHDLIGRLQRRLCALVDALVPFASLGVSDESLCHKGLVNEEDCGRCGPILRARRALSDYEVRRDAIVSDAARAVEVFGEDELERHAEEIRKEKATDEG